MSEFSSSSTQSYETIQRFVQFVMMQAQQILYFLGNAGSEGESTTPNLEGAKILIDQLEMIKLKTKGNLSDQEVRILDEALSRVQLAYVQTTEGPASKIAASPSSPTPSTPASQAQPAPAPAPPQEPKPTDNEEPENKKRFVKKYE